MVSRAMQGTVKKTPRPSRVREEARALYRAAILDNAEEVFAEKGVSAARVQDIAERAGLAVGTIYNYFEQKEDVLYALLEERMAGFLEAFEARADDPSALVERLVQRVARLLAYIASHQAFFQLASDHGLFGAATASTDALLSGKKLPHAGRYEREIRIVIDEAAKAGLLRPLAKELLALHLRHCIRTASRWLKQQPDLDVIEVAQLGVDLFLDGTAKRPAKKRRN
jgi:AcrR family transcriptional regulator